MGVPFTSAVGFRSQQTRAPLVWVKLLSQCSPSPLHRPPGGEGQQGILPRLQVPPIHRTGSGNRVGQV